ncbi:AAA family ATPase [Salinispora sp. H7-4]|uniref:HelD family protein n=1 Tax=Salinispora sp. H7-4 TaxID=2748321 RepID=UPI0015D150F2|nr:AAA family ATPase [Salinispora sp. H7-4]NYT96796.1 AAA family ATPase [Salinispora sp. H7-4]
MPADHAADRTVDLTVELDAERAHMATSRAALHAMREHAEAMYAVGAKIAGDPFSAETLGVALARRVAELADDPRTPLFFGRLDLDGAAEAGAGPEPGAAAEPGPAPEPGAGPVPGRYHIGRRHVTDQLGEPLVLDWRAPVSRAFYQASVRDPQGVRTRRRFGFAGGDLTSFEDERLDQGEEFGTTSKILIEEIERPRVGPMRDIVATIQPEQDELVRADLDTSICVQGAPGTGKTAVGLHRAAYLLYLHRERLRRTGVLILGPNPAFLGYISAVLPALGELEVRQATLEGLIGRVPVSGVDPVEAEVIKHDPRMATVLRRALWSRLGRAESAIQVSDGAYRWRIDPGVLTRLVDDTRREDPAYLLGRERVRARVVGLLQRQAETRSGESPGEPWQRRMGKAKPVVEFLDACWPAVTPQSLVFELLSDAEALARAAEGILTETECQALRWPRRFRSVKSVRWSSADLVLLDEAAGLLERESSLHHIIIDEAQDLSPMQCRAIARRTTHGSITLLGDLAQGTAPWAATDWAESLRHLGKPDAAVVPLTTGFRVPEAVVALANRLLPALEVNVPPAVSLRSDGGLVLRRVDDLAAEVVAELAATRSLPGSVGVIAADRHLDELRAALVAAGEEPGGLDAPESGRVTVVPATLAKGLEYDHVIVVEPAEIVDAEPRGLHRLYVVLTRAVTRLTVLHARPLPGVLATDALDQATGAAVPAPA